MDQRRILIVDDDPSALLVLEAFLIKMGYRVLSYQDPVRALEHLKTDDVDVLLTDVRMPHMNGILLMEESKKIRPSLPVILITSFADLKTAVAAVKQGAFDYLQKPYQFDKISASLAQALSGA